MEMNRPGMIKRLLIGTVAASALLGGAAAMSPASADAGTRVTGASTQETNKVSEYPKFGCVITGDNVNFRTIDGTSLGQVNRGQKMNVHQYNFYDGYYGGYLWGDDRYVFVYAGYVDC